MRDIFPLSFSPDGIKSGTLLRNMKSQEPKAEKRKILIRVKPEERVKPTEEVLNRLRKAAEEKGWMRKK